MLLKRFIALSTLNKISKLRGLLSLGSVAYPFMIYTYSRDNQFDLTWPLFYPVCMNFMMAVIFGISLVYPPTLIERIARLREPNLDARGVAYTRQVTKIWFVFCVLNMLTSLLTAVSGNIQVWAIYNGVISYCLMGILFAGEYGVRCYLRRQNRL